MAKKCPKNFSDLFKNKSQTQRTLAEMWLFERNSVEKADEKDKNNFINQSSSNSDTAASPRVRTEPKLTKKVKKTVPTKNARQSIASSKTVNQSVRCKSKSEYKENLLKTPKSMRRLLPKRLKLSLSPKFSPTKLKTPKLSQTKLKAPSLTPKKESSVAVPNMNDEDEKLSVSNNCDNSVAGEEFLPNDLECSSTIINCEAKVEEAEENENQEERDPLHIDEKEKSRILMEQENRERDKNISAIKKKKQGLVLLKHDQLVVKQGKVLLKKTSPIRRKSKDFSKTFLRRLHVKLLHIVPPQHKIESCAGTHPLRKKEILLFENYGPLKRGPYTKVEDETIKQNWKNFCKFHDWDENVVEPFLQMRHEGKYYMPHLEERKNFVRFLANGLPWRSLYSVYGRFKNLYNSVNSGPYTVEEDRQIIKFVCKEAPPKKSKMCAVLARILNRKRHSIWQRYQILKIRYNLEHLWSDDSSSSDLTSDEEPSSKSEEKNLHPIVSKVYKQVNWSFALVSRFLDKLIETMSCKDIEDLKNQTISDEIWKQMEVKMSIDQMFLKNFWNLQLHMQLFCPKPLYLNDLRMDLIEYLYKNKSNSESIDWNEVKLAFDGVTPDFLSKVFNHLVQDVKTKLKTIDMKISDIIEYLYTVHIHELEEKTMDAVLPKVYHSNGKIIGVNKTERPSKGITTNPLSDGEYED